MIYNLKSLKRDNWFQFRKFKHCYTSLTPALGANGKVVTGLVEDTKIVNKKGNYEIVEGTRRKLERELFLDEGTLLNSSPFWDTYVIKIGIEEIILDEDIPEDKLKLGVLKNIPEVAVGMAQLKTKAKADFLLYSKGEEAKVNNIRRKTKREASIAFDALSPEDMRDALTLYGIVVKDLSAEVMEDKLGDLLEDNPTKFLAIVKDPDKEAKKFVRMCLDRGVLSNDDGVIFYNETMIGLDISNAARELFQGKHVKIKEAIKEVLSVKEV